jgi:hypothetical protein
MVFEPNSPYVGLSHREKVLVLAGGDTSLDLLRESVGEISPERCPRTPWDVICLDDLEKRFSGTCNTWRCVYCGPRKARQKAAVMTYAKPERFVTLTRAPKDWQTLRMKLRDLRRVLIEEGYQWELAWTVELTKKGVPHVHGLQHGVYVPKKVLDRHWGAITDIKEIEGVRGAAGYAMKEACRVSGYAMKGIREIEAHLDRNGGRGMHLTRGYLRGQTTGEVLKQMQRDRNGGNDLRWMLIPKDAPAEAVKSGLLRAAAIPPEMALS